MLLIFRGCWVCQVMCVNFFNGGHFLTADFYRMQVPNQLIVLILHDAYLNFIIHGKLIAHHCPVCNRIPIPFLYNFVVITFYWIQSLFLFFLFHIYCSTIGENWDDIEWVYKNGDTGQQYFSIVYVDEARTFYGVVFKKFLFNLNWRGK